MPDNAAQDRGSGRPLAMSAYSIVERARVELPVTGRWPKAWRLLFLVGGAVLAWVAVVLVIRWV